MRETIPLRLEFDKEILAFSATTLRNWAGRVPASPGYPRPAIQSNLQVQVRAMQLSRLVWARPARAKTMGERRHGVEESGQDARILTVRRRRPELAFRPPERKLEFAAQARQAEALRPSPLAFLSRCGRDSPSRYGPGSVTCDTPPCDVGHVTMGRRFAAESPRQSCGIAQQLLIQRPFPALSAPEFAPGARLAGTAALHPSWYRNSWFRRVAKC